MSYASFPGAGYTPMSVNKAHLFLAANGEGLKALFHISLQGSGSLDSIPEK